MAPTSNDFVDYTRNKPEINTRLMSWHIKYIDGSELREVNDKNEIITRYTEIRHDSIVSAHLYLTDDIEHRRASAVPFVHINFPTAESKFLWRARTIQMLEGNEIKSRIFIMGWRQPVDDEFDVFKQTALENFVYIHFAPDPDEIFRVYAIRSSNAENNMEYRPEELFDFENIDKMNANARPPAQMQEGEGNNGSALRSTG